MATRFSFQMPDGEKFRLGFLRMAEGVEQLQPMLWSIQGALEEWEGELYRSQGASGSGKWAPHSPATVAIRREQGLGDGPVGESTGRLRAAFTERGAAGALRSVGPSGLVFGVRGIDYALYQQHGASQTVTERQRMFLGRSFGVWMKRGHVIKMPRRPVLDLGTGPQGVSVSLRKGIINAGRDHVLAATRKAFGGTPPGGWDREIERGFDAALERRGGV